MKNVFLLVPFPGSTYSLFFFFFGLLNDGERNAAEKNATQGDNSP